MNYNYVVGWNDIANGIINWSNNTEYPSIVAWVLKMKKTARQNKLLDSDYVRGVCVAVDYYLNCGTIERK